MEHAINEAMFEFALICQSMMENGWKFVKIDYAERGLGPTLTIKKDDDVREIYHYGELKSILNDLWV